MSTATDSDIELPFAFQKPGHPRQVSLGAPNHAPPPPRRVVRSRRSSSETSIEAFDELMSQVETPEVPNKPAGSTQRRPYLPAHERREIAQCVASKRARAPRHLYRPTTFHVDMTEEEIKIMTSCVNKFERPNSKSFYKVVRVNDLDEIRNLRGQEGLTTYLSEKLEGRNASDVYNFLDDLPETDHSRPQYQVSLARDDFLSQQRRRDRRINTLRLDREMHGSNGVGLPMRQQSLQTESLKDLGDSMGHPIARFGPCSGDVATMTWVSPRTVVCGNMSTMDDYNKSSNLVLYDTTANTFKSHNDHRVPRALKEGERLNFSKSKWMYPPVVASATDSKWNLLYTASFDKTVRVWKTEGTTVKSLTLVGTWPHEGKVNFVASALDNSGLVATAADVSTDAIRVYRTNPRDSSASRYISLPCPRPDAHGNDEWSYWPSTMQWGTAEGTRHLLAVGYSPRSRDGDENQIPEDKRRTGAILLWDSKTGKVIPVYAPTVANVFEVVWHPNLSQLIVATSRSGLHVEKGVRTQIHVWKQDPDRLHTDQGWHQYKTLDCTAEDINELTVMPNSSHHTYITASCTSGEIFVWDTARGDRPIHILRHGPTVEPFQDEEERQQRDVGVKFTAWGDTPDRLFTGSSDGKVKVWNVRNTKRPFIRTIMQGEGAIFCGAFSPDKKLLAIGDGPGNVWVLTDPDRHPESWGEVCRKRPVPVTCDEDEDEVKETQDQEDDADYPRQRFLDTFQLISTGDPLVGMAQGPAYHESGHFEKKSHLDEDPTAPLIPAVERLQQAAVRATHRRKRSMRRLRPVSEHTEQIQRLHSENYRKDFDPEDLAPADLEALRIEGVELSVPAEDFAYESEGSDF